MAANSETEVIINGKVYTLSGESEEYLQKVASYLNAKIAEFDKIEAFRKLSLDYRTILMEINIADDYFREQKKNELLQEDMQTKDKDLYDLKHELITTQMKLENTEKTMRSLRQESEERAKRIIQLEAELKSLGR
ncbi:MAG: cell division protein ZapA [Lachnospiraceae bacterium]|nr:cell division protein ZapA [Lachnospiraceae bacterium]MBQ2627434.1 cell division protein ZapA [Eubacterium sp.]MBQ6363945.1 cell division protein ZapA [Lachnospiraceae bacterium]MBR2995147.1 cell division protein ZapA [Lachnospiraceae bacterium]